MMNLDDTDRALLAAMLEDARISQRALARKVGIAQGTVLNRIRRMENMGLIKGYSVVLDPASMGWSMTIMAGLRIVKGRMIDVQRRIAAVCSLRCNWRLGLNGFGSRQEPRGPR